MYYCDRKKDEERGRNRQYMQAGRIHADRKKDEERGRNRQYMQAGRRNDPGGKVWNIWKKLSR